MKAVIGILKGCAICHYHVWHNVCRAWAQLNLTEYIGANPESDFDLAQIVERGLPAETLSFLKEEGLTFTEVADLIISPRTLQHRKARGNQQLAQEEADKVVRIARILALAEQVFGNHGKRHFAGCAGRTAGLANAQV